MARSPDTHMFRNRRLALIVFVALGLLVAGAADAALPAATSLAPGRAVVVGEFTTRFPSGQPRVGNIVLAVRTLDRTVVPPQGYFSLNAALGERTIAKGYRPAPTIAGGRFVDSVGGGISQVATTLYNAAFFAGLELVAHTPHSVYIDRYPPGREATISWGGPELVFRNQWLAPLTIRVTTTATSITVRMLSQPLGRRVAAWSGKPYAVERPTTVQVVNPALAPGSSRLVQQAGGSGFAVDYGRSVYQRGKLLERRSFHVRYEPENRIVEVGPRRNSLLAAMPSMLRLPLVRWLERVLVAERADV